MSKEAEKQARARLKAAMVAPAMRPTMDAFLDHFFAVAGGPAKVATMLFEEYQHAPPGSLIRNRVLDLVLKCLKTAESRGSPMDQLAEVTDADLTRMIDEKERVLLGAADDQEKDRHFQPRGAPNGPGPVVPPAAPGPGPAAGPAPAP